MKKILLLVMLLLLIASQSFSATYYFSQSGTGDGLSPGSPDSIADHNSGSFSAGDIIYLLSTITTTVQPPSSGSGGTYITYRGDYSGSEATIDTASGAGFYVAQDYIKIQNITIDDTVTGGINCGAGTTYFWATGVTITDGASNGIKVSANNDNDSHNILIENCTITGNGSNGIWLSWGDVDVGEAGIIYSVDIMNNTISNNSGYRVRMFSADNTNDKAYDILISGNTIQNNAINGVLFIAMNNTSGENKISYNTISENSTANTLGGIHISRCANPIVEYNLVYSNHTNGIDGIFMVG